MFGPDDVNSTEQIWTIDYARANRETEMEMKEEKNENMPHMKYTLIVECMGWMREGERERVSESKEIEHYRMAIFFNRKWSRTLTHVFRFFFRSLTRFITLYYEHKKKHRTQISNFCITLKWGWVPMGWMAMVGGGGSSCCCCCYPPPLSTPSDMATHAHTYALTHIIYIYGFIYLPCWHEYISVVHPLDKRFRRSGSFFGLKFLSVKSMMVVAATTTAATNANW